MCSVWWKDLGIMIMLCINEDCDDVEAYNVWLTSLVSSSRWETMEQVWDTSILGLSERWNADSWGRPQNFHPGIPCPAWIPTWITSMSNVLPWWWNTSCTTKGCGQRTVQCETLSNRTRVRHMGASLGNPYSRLLFLVSRKDPNNFLWPLTILTIASSP